MGLAKTFLAIGIAVILAAVIGYGLYVFYPEPKWYEESSYANTEYQCSQTYNCEKLIEDCRAQFTSNNTEVIAAGSDTCYETVRQTTNYKSCMENQDKCREEAQKQTLRYRHSRNNFFILVIIGVVIILLGAFITRYEGIGSGFIGGGILTIIYALVRGWNYWFEVNKYAKLLILLAVLLLLIFLGYKKIEKRLQH